MKYLVAADDYFLEYPNGAGRVGWEIAQEVLRCGGEVGLVCIDRKDRPFTPPVAVEEGVRVLKVVVPKLPVWHPRRPQAASLAVKKAVESSFGREHWDILHIHSVRTGLGVLDGLQSRPRVLTTAHSPIVLEYLANNTDKELLSLVKSSIGIPLLWNLERKQFKSSDAIHVLSQFTKKKLRQFHRVQDKITIIPFWKREGMKRTLSKREARERLGWPLEEQIFFTLRNHSPRTGVDIGIRGIAPFAKSGRCHFYIGGSGPLLSYHKKLVEDLGISERVQLMGRISDADLELAYQAADVFVLPTRALECFGLIILEAFSYGCPVLGADVGAIPELLGPITPDFLFTPDCVEAMEEKFKMFLDGHLLPPSPEVLVDYVSKRYGRDVLIPKMIDWIWNEAGMTPPNTF